VIDQPAAAETEVLAVRSAINRENPDYFLWHCGERRA
jgi:hypothetical protein